LAWKQLKEKYTLRFAPRKVELMKELETEPQDEW